MSATFVVLDEAGHGDDDEEDDEGESAADGDVDDRGCVLHDHDRVAPFGGVRIFAAEAFPLEAEPGDVVGGGGDVDGDVDGDLGVGEPGAGQPHAERLRRRRDVPLARDVQPRRRDGLDVRNVHLDRVRQRFRGLVLPPELKTWDLRRHRDYELEGVVVHYPIFHVVQFRLEPYQFLNLSFSHVNTPMSPCFAGIDAEQQRRNH